MTNNLNIDKHILVKENTKTRVSGYLNKSETWDVGIQLMCDFIDDNKEKFDEFKQHKASETK